MALVRKYVLHPREIRSKSDGQIHWVGFMQLIELYGISPRLCIDASCNTGFCREIDLEINLYPRHDGKYRNRDGTPNITGNE